ncbi:MAG: DUF2878 domain-containing protein [Acidobacteria bacterium]|nr:DUF2878 domain-containing protein [Acidobacteriota bacterium]
MRHTRLVNYALYQLGWVACVLGSAWHRPWTGFLIATILVGVHLRLSRERTLDTRLIVLTTTVGAVVEFSQIEAGTYRFTSGAMIDALPPAWLLAMWAQFATTFRFSLRGVIMRPVSAALFGAVGGPLAFLAGERLGAVILLPPLTQGLVRLSLSWAVALVVFSAVVRRITRGEADPIYRSAR